MSRAGARLYPLTAFVHLPYSPTIARRYRPGENASSRKCGRSGAGVRTAALFRDPFRSPFQGGRSDHIRSILQSPPNTGGRLRGGVDRVGFVRILTKSTLVLVTEVLRLVLPIRSRPINPIRSSPAGGGPGFFRDCRHVSGYDPGSGRAARAVRGRCGRLRAALWRLRDALPGSTGNGFVSGALLPLVASRAVCVGRIYSGLWRNYG